MIKLTVYMWDEIMKMLYSIQKWHSIQFGANVPTCSQVIYKLKNKISHYSWESSWMLALFFLSDTCLSETRVQVGGVVLSRIIQLAR